MRQLALMSVQNWMNSLAKVDMIRENEECKEKTWRCVVIFHFAHKRSYWASVLLGLAHHTFLNFLTYFYE